VKVLSPREASIFACICDTVVAPKPVLPAVRDTDAVEAFDEWLARGPRGNRLALRGLLYLAELAPLLVHGGRLRSLLEPERGRALAAAERSRLPRVGPVVRLMKGLAFLCYYGDDEVMRRLGYDPDANLRRAQAVRA
jgi:hypothetical protein